MSSSLFYSDDLLMEICNFFQAEFIYKETQGLNRWFILKKKADFLKINPDIREIDISRNEV